MEAYLNYHSTGGLIYQRPANIPSDLLKDNNLELSAEENTITNYLLSRLYSEKTYKNANDKENTHYMVLKGENSISTSNDYNRLINPGNILIELSGMGGNPIGPYGDIKGNYTNLMKSNLGAFEYLLKVNELAHNVSKASLSVMRKLKKSDDKEHEQKLRYDVMDLIFKEFNGKVQALLSQNKSVENRNEDLGDYR